MNLTIPILMYHQIKSEPQSYYPLHTTAPSTFAKQMKLLKRLGYNTIDMDQLHEYKNGSGKLPSKPIIITFDDGFVDAIENAAPVLSSLNYTAVFYIPTDYIGKIGSWFKSKLGFDFPVIDVDKIIWLDSQGFRIGCHSMSHPHLDAISTEDSRMELSLSKKYLEDILGHDVNHLAYPYGSYNENVIIIAKDTGFVTACTTEEGFCTSDDDNLALPRINIEAKDSLLDFIMKLHTGKGVYPYLVSKVPDRMKKIIKNAINRK